MELSEIAKRLPWFLDAGICVEITGASGIGKSEVVEQVKETMEKRDGFPWSLGRHFAATWGPCDVTGYLAMGMSEIVNENGEKQAVPSSHFSMPPWMLDDMGRPMNSRKRGICVFEEYDKAIVEVKKALAPVTLMGRIANWALHAGIGRVILSNDASSSRQGSTKDFDFTINRKCILTGTASLQGWLAWADANNVDPIYKAFAEEHPQVVFSGTVPEKQGPFCTPRSLVLTSEISKYAMNEDGVLIDTEGFTEIATGFMGAPAARDLLVWLKMRGTLPKWSEIVAKPTQAKVPDDAGGQSMVAHICAHNVDEKTMEPAVKYIKRLRPEVHIIFCKSATRRNFRLVNAKPFEKWTNEEPRLVSLLNVLGGAR